MADRVTVLSPTDRPQATEISNPFQPVRRRASPYRKFQPRADGRRFLRVLIAEDNPVDVYLVRVALETHGFEVEMKVEADGEEMLSHIGRLEAAGEGELPDLLLLDLNLPKCTGDVLLERWRGSQTFDDVPVVIVTSSNSARDRARVEQLGANAYFRKPSDFDEFLKLGAVAKSVLGIGDEIAN